MTTTTTRLWQGHDQLGGSGKAVKTLPAGVRMLNSLFDRKFYRLKRALGENLGERRKVVDIGLLGNSPGVMIDKEEGETSCLKVSSWHMDQSRLNTVYIL